MTSTDNDNDNDDAEAETDLDPDYIQQLEEGGELVSRILGGETQEDRTEAAVEASIASEEPDEPDDSYVFETAINIGIVRAENGEFWAQIQGTKSNPLGAVRETDSQTLHISLFNALSLILSPHMSQEEFEAHQSAFADILSG